METQIMLFRRMSIVVGLMALTLGNPPILAQSNSPSNVPFSPNRMDMAQSHGGGGNREMGEGYKERMFEQLNLTDAQKQQLQDIRQRYGNQMQPLHESLRNQQNELRQLMAGNASDGEIRAKHNEVLTIRQQLGNLHFESMLEMRNILDADQRAQLAQVMENHRQGRWNRRNNDNSQGQRRQRGLNNQ
jgi:periplasmic protein CpxP/Spy